MTDESSKFIEVITLRPNLWPSTVKVITKNWLTKIFVMSFFGNTLDTEILAFFGQNPALNSLFTKYSPYLVKTKVFRNKFSVWSVQKTSLLGQK